jgi:hypothetical protein
MTPVASRLGRPETLDDLLLYRMARLPSVAGSMVIRLCEGRFGITRREWRLLGVLAQEPTMVQQLDAALAAMQQQAELLVAQAELPKADRRRGGRVRGALA